MFITRENIEGEILSKRDQILNAAYEVFSRKGYHKATIDEIIAVADTGKGTVYNYFKNKETLFQTLVQEKSAPFEKAIQAVAESTSEPLEKIQILMCLFLKFYVANADLWRVLMHEVRGFDAKEQVSTERDWFIHTIGLLEKVLAEGIEKGTFRSCDVKKAAYALFSIVVVMVFQNLVGDDVEETAQNITDIFLYGIVKE